MGGNLFNDYKRELSGNNRKNVLILFIIIVIALGAWAAWHYGLKKNASEQSIKTDNNGQSSVKAPPQDTNDSLASAGKSTDSKIQKIV